MDTALVAADARASGVFVQANFNTEFVLGNAGTPSCLSQAAPKKRNRLFSSHSANIVEIALRFSTKFVESKTSHERPE
ncbi:conserved hypothetical protein [Cupriavidus neocaledonicus]|uniref:Uncharacterized protein n=1 Tax=Cupriavidus neocaledonicus TaxID=1040979 RepID=A0ABY1V0K9_9BURK|nr:conserved hypothetical protein [Cupriavidus neocaledonicus]